MYRVFLICVSAVVCVTNLKAQEKVWTLEECVDYALEENLAVKQSRLNRELTEQSQLQSYGNLLPNVSGNATHIYNYGQTIDPYTNTFASDLVRSNNFRVGANWVLFDGMQNLNNVKRADLDILAAQYGVKANEFEVILQVTSAYLDVLFNKEQLKAVESQIELTQNQLHQSKKQLEAGAIPEGEYLNVEAQLAQEELNKIDRENDLNLSMLTLKQLLLLKADAPFQISDPDEFDAGELRMPGNQRTIVDNSVNNFPSIKQRQMEVQVAEKDIQLAKGGFSPVITATGAMATGYSGLRTEVVGVERVGQQTVGEVAGTGQEVVAPRFEQQLRDQPFGNQLDENLNRTFGINVNVPIFNNFTNRVNLNRARIQKEISITRLEQEELNITRDVERAYADAMASFKRYKATEKSMEAVNKAFEYAEKRFEVGMTNAVDYNTAKNNVTRTETDLIRSKYELMFRLKILDFYQGADSLR